MKLRKQPGGCRVFQFARHFSTGRVGESFAIGSQANSSHGRGGYEKSSVDWKGRSCEGRPRGARGGRHVLRRAGDGRGERRWGEGQGATGRGVRVPARGEGRWAEGRGTRGAGRGAEGRGEGARGDGRGPRGEGRGGVIALVSARKLGLQAAAPFEMTRSSSCRSATHAAASKNFDDPADRGTAYAPVAIGTANSRRRA